MSVAKQYCQAIYDEHGHITQDLLVAYDERHGKQLLTWNDKEAARKFRIDEAGEWIAKIALDRQEGKARRVYVNAVKNNVRAYFPVEDIVANDQAYNSACRIFLSQIEGLTRQYSYLEEARAVAETVEGLKSRAG